MATETVTEYETIVGWGAAALRTRATVGASFLYTKPRFPSAMTDTIEFDGDRVVEPSHEYDVDEIDWIGVHDGSIVIDLDDTE